MKFSKLLENIPDRTKRTVREQNIFAEKLASALKIRGISSEEFAKQAGIKLSRLKDILAGNAHLMPKTIQKIEGFLK